MTHPKKPKCACCAAKFVPDPRTGDRQKYCSKIGCKKASKKASQLKWLQKPENQNYFRGKEAVTRVQAAQKAQPEYRERAKARRAAKMTAALQDDCPPQVPDSKEENSAAPAAAAAPQQDALQDDCRVQGIDFIVILGLCAHIFGFTLQDDMAQTWGRLRKLGLDILNGRNPDELIERFKASNFARADAAGAGAV